MTETEIKEAIRKNNDDLRKLKARQDILDRSFTRLRIKQRKLVKAFNEIIPARYYKDAATSEYWSKHC